MTNTNNFKKITAVYVCSFIVCTALAAVGSFCDYSVSQTLYKPVDILFLLISNLGQYIFFGALVLFGAVLFKQTGLNENFSAVKKFLLRIPCVVVMLFGAFIGAGSLLHSEGFGAFDAVAKLPHALTMSVLVLIFIPLIVCGVRSTREYDKQLVGRLVRVLILLIVIFFATTHLKSFFARPRFRTTLKGYEGVGFLPWYDCLGDADVLAKKFGTDNNDFRSFPSGHAWMAGANLFIFPFLAYVFDKFKGREFMLTVCGAVTALLVMLSRIVLGAHYLSDVSIGAFCGTLFCFILFMTEKKLDK